MPHGSAEGPGTVRPEGEGLEAHSELVDLEKKDLTCSHRLGTMLREVALPVATCQQHCSQKREQECILLESWLEALRWETFCPRTCPEPRALCPFTQDSRSCPQHPWVLCSLSQAAGGR